MAESKTAVVGEKGIGFVPPRDLEIFVPSSRVSQVRDLVRSSRQDCPVRSLSAVLERLQSWDTLVAQIAEGADRQWST